MPEHSPYEMLLENEEWRDALLRLNTHLRRSLEAAGMSTVLNGNLFYGHLQAGFWEAPLLESAEGKRRRFSHAASMGSSLLEVGLNGGHSAFLALTSNPKLSLTSIDACFRFHPDWAAVEVYVDAAASWLKQEFPGRFSFVRADSRTAFGDTDFGTSFDLLHLDGDKHNYPSDLRGASPWLQDGALIVVDDTNLPYCKGFVDALLAADVFHRHPAFPTMVYPKHKNEVLVLPERDCFLSEPSPS